MKRKTGKITGVILLLLLAAVLVIGLVYHRAVKAVFYNNVTLSIDMDTSEVWENGSSYLRVPYAEVSENQYVDIYVPDGVDQPPLFVLVHGGGFITNDSQARQTQLMYRYFRDQGYACATVNYRLADEAPFPGALEDVKACVRFLKANAAVYGFDAERVAVFGESAGAYLAIMTSVTNDKEFSDLKFIGEEELSEKYSSSVDVLVDFYGTAEFGTHEEYWKESGYPQILIEIANSWIRGEAVQGYETSHSFWIRQNESELSEEEYAIYSAYTYAEENLSDDSDLSVWISHGDCDITVPIQCSEEFAERMTEILGADDVKLHIVEHAGHAKDIMYTEEELQLIDTFLREHLH